MADLPRQGGDRPLPGVDFFDPVGWIERREPQHKLLQGKRGKGKGEEAIAHNLG